MKKFISILTTACLLATSLVSATLPTASAADKVLFTFKDRASGSSTMKISASELASGPVTVTCDMEITKYVPFYGMSLKFDWENTDTNTIYDAGQNNYFTPTADSGYDDKGCFTNLDGYLDGDMTPKPGYVASKNFNVKQMISVWATGAKDEDDVATNAYFIENSGNAFLHCVFTVASNTPEGTYIFDIKREDYQNSLSTPEKPVYSSSSVDSISGAQVGFDTVPLTIVVGDGGSAETTTTKKSETTATTTTTKKETAATTTTTKKETPAGLTYSIGEVIAEAGASVDVPVTVSGDPGSGGIVLQFNVDSALTFTRRVAGDAYEGEPTWNKADYTFVWHSSNGRNVKAEDDAVIMKLRFTAPSEPGKYPVAFLKSACSTSDQEGDVIAASYVDGFVTVLPTGGTTAKTNETAASTTTTKKDIPSGLSYIIGDVDAEPGASVDVPVTVKGDTGSGGIVLQFNVDSALTFTRRVAGDAYEGEPTWNKEDYTFVWHSSNGRNVIAEDGAVVLKLRFTAPSEPGKYPVSFLKSACSTSDQEGDVIAASYVDGFVTVGEPIITSSTSNTTAATTTTKKETPAGLTYSIGEVIAEAGASVDVPVTVSGDPGSGGIVLQFNVDSALTFTRRVAGDAYEGEPTWNKADYTFVWHSSNGRNVKAEDDAVIMKLRFTAPSEPGTYPVSFLKSACSTSDQEGDVIAASYVDGFVTVLPVGETTTSTTTTKQAETTTTTTTTSSLTPDFGDVNLDGKVSVADAVLLNRAIAGTADLNAQAKLNADCKFDKTLNTDDSLQIMRYLVHLIEKSVLGQA